MKKKELRRRLAVAEASVSRQRVSIEKTHRHLEDAYRKGYADGERGLPSLLDYMENAWPRPGHPADEVAT